MSDVVEKRDTGTTVKDRPIVKRPPLYVVLVHNDDFTPMDYVVGIFRSFFHKQRVEAETLMRQVHEKGMAIAGTYTYEIAETKVLMVLDDAQKHGHPLLLTMEVA